MKRFYFTRVTGQRGPYVDILVAGVIEAETRSAAQAVLDTALRARKSPTTHANFDWLDLDVVPSRSGGILATTVVAGRAERRPRPAPCVRSRSVLT